MTTGRRFLSIPRDLRHVLALVALALGLGELENTFTISFWEPSKGPRVMETDFGLRMGLFIWPLPTPVRTGSGSKGFAGLRSQPAEAGTPGKRAI